jgi:hypothetical protein
VKKVFLAIAGLLTFAIPVAASSEASAYITGCYKSEWNNGFNAKCTVKNNYAPNHTQWAASAQCYNGNNQKIGITTGWHYPAITLYGVRCPTSYPNLVPYSTYFLFR